MISKKLKIGKKTLKNRLVISPMCQYSSKGGGPNDWHFKHYSTLAGSNSAMLILESTAVNTKGKITPFDLCLSNYQQFLKFKNLVKHLKRVNNKILLGIQISHSGRKGSSNAPWKNSSPLKKNAWKTIAPSSLKRSSINLKPKEMTKSDIHKTINDFKNSALLANKAGFDVLEIHMAHGYLLHQFYSPISNIRTDAYGKNKNGRIKLLLEISEEIRSIWPKNKILGARITGTDHLKNGLQIKDGIDLTKKLEDRGFDYVSVSSGGILPKTNLKIHVPAFRAKLSKKIKKNVKKIKITTSGNLNDVRQIDKLIKNKSIDFATVARPFLKNTNWINENYKKNKMEKFIPKQYLRAFL